MAPKKLEPLHSVTKQSDDAMDAAKLRQLHIEKEKSLLDSLQSQMIQKKRMLDDRLKRKREQRVKTELLQEESATQNARVGIAKQEEFEAEYDKKTSQVSRNYDKLFHEPSRRIEEEGKEFWELADFLTEGHVK